MEFPCKVKYGGYWLDDGCVYEGGTEIRIKVSVEHMTMYNFRYYISQCCNLTSSNFVISYLRRPTRSARVIKRLLTTNEDIADMFTSVRNPTVHVASTDVASSSHATASSSQLPLPEQPQSSVPYYDQASYEGSFFDQSQQNIPFFDPSQSYGSSSIQNNPNVNWDDIEQIRRVVASSSWMGDEYLGDGNNTDGNRLHRSSNVQEHTIPDLNDTADVGHQVPSSDDDSDDEDGDYVPESDTSTESEGGSNLYHGSRQMNRALFAEWTAWIHEKGGMQKLLGMMYPFEYEDIREVDTDTEHMSNWLVPVVPPRPRDSAVFEDRVVNIDELGKDAMFWNKKEIKLAVGLWHLHRRHEYTVERSDRRRMYFRCKLSKQCPFSLTLTSDGGPWTVSVFNEEHSCSALALLNNHRRKAKSDVIGEIFAQRLLRDSELIRPRVMQSELKVNFGVDVSYDVALKGRNKAIEIVYGSHKHSFNDLLGYLHMLKMSNPGTVTEYELSDEGRFRHVFVALAASRHAYIQGYIRPVVVVDGTHLKGKNCGVMFVAVAKDANEQLFPLAYGIGPTEDNESWTWFMQCLRGAFGDLPGHLIVSDMHASIIHAVREVFPNTFHGFCYYHLLKKLVMYGSNVCRQYLHAAYTCNRKDFRRYMAGIRRTSRLAFNKLMEVTPEKWSRSCCPARRFSNMTSNAAESFNASILWARRLPICACLDAIRLIIEEWFSERREKCRDNQEVITTEARRKLVQDLRVAQTYTVRRISDVPQFRVQTPKREYTVDLNEYLCECESWQKNCLPCTHAIAAIRANHHTVADYVAPFYKQTMYAACFSVPINSVPHKENWTVPQQYKNVTVLPPIWTRLPGRPRDSRIRGRGEGGRGRGQGRRGRGQGGRGQGGGGQGGRGPGRRKKNCLHCWDPNHHGSECPNVSHASDASDTSDD